VGQRLSVLCLEDDPADAELMAATLTHDGLDTEFTRVESEMDFCNALVTGDWDVILADYALPAFNGLAALVISKDICPDIPFILVSGTLGEEPAIEALTQGATDYVLKHKLARLAPAVRRALSESAERKERRQAEASAQVLHEENRYLARALLAIQEEERRHLARELHDEIGQCLTAIQVHTEMIRRRVDGADEDILASVDAVHNITAGIYETVHAVLQRLRPAALDNLGLVEALEDTVSAWQERDTGIAIDFQHQGRLSDFGEQINITLFRIIQECLTNTANHSDASRVEIRLEGPDSGGGASDEQDPSVTLVVRDDGRGLEEAPQRLGFGLIGMRERVEALSGSFDLHGPGGAGVTVSVRLPLEPSAG
jgi:signal transduction histidine kinase